jgi:hypothetical protein
MKTTGSTVAVTVTVADPPEAAGVEGALVSYLLAIASLVRNP